MDIDFRAIVSGPGGQPAVFEELCCQLARRAELPRPFVRLRGEGGDGGIEGYVDLPDGKRGWQAKYMFDPSRLVKHASKSLRTALKNHPDLKSFVLCFPFDPTGRTGRGEGSSRKLEDWKAAELRYATEKGHHVEIELWPASELRSLIVEYDHSGGMSRFFFGSHVLTDQWFKEHLDQAAATAGPRYTPEVSVSTNMAKWLAAFGRTSEWSNALSERLLSLEKCISNLHVTDPPKNERKVVTTESDSPWGTWPSNSRSKVRSQAAAIQRATDALRSTMPLDKQKFFEVKHLLQSSCEEFRSVEEDLTLDLDRKYGEGKWDSPGWRQHVAEWEASLPAANVDATRRVILTLDALVDWLDSPEFALGLEGAFLLTGPAGSGKTHGVCDIAHQRHQQGLRTCLLFGHEFGEGLDPWTRIAETLGLPTFGRERLLDAMNSAGEASGAPLIVCVDAINETKPLRYWYDRLRPLLQAVGSKPFLRACIVCRTEYVLACLPEGTQLLQVEHQGFSGLEREACRAYFEHYGLQPPAMPTLLPEISNPLYLRLVCETAAFLGLSSLPTDWAGSVPAIEAFLQTKERRFANSHELTLQARFMRRTLTALVDHLVAREETHVSWPVAIEVAFECVGLDREQTARNLEWIVREGLLIEDGPRDPYSGEEGRLRPAFERLGDFLVADAILSKNADSTLEVEPWIRTVGDIDQRRGVLGVLSVLLPERRGGSELPDMTDDPKRSAALLKLTVDALPSRSAFTSRSEDLVRRALSTQDLSFLTMERLVSIAWRPSLLDAHWLHRLLRSRALAARDAYWCTFLHESYTAEGVVAQLIEAAFDLPLDYLDQPVAERWVKLLIWFTAAADRRVKDRATRAIVAVLAGRPAMIPELADAMHSIDDDALRERFLLAAYGALLRTRNLDALRALASALHHRYTQDPSAFSNALIRDHVRAICELAAHLDVLPEGIDAEFAGQAVEEGSQPLPLPSEDDVKAWGESIRFWPNEFSDFFKYSMWCVRRWEHSVPREDMAKWMLQTIAMDFEFVGSRCEHYDKQMLGKYGGGRSKPVWAERIGKKYMWVAMHRLASKLHDTVVPKRDEWELEPTGTPLILGEGRHIDPSLPGHGCLSKRHPFFRVPNFDTVGVPDDRAWIALEEDVPSIVEILDVQSANGQNWRPLAAYLKSERPEDHHRSDSLYREIWLHLLGYLVRSGHAAPLFKKLGSQNFYSQWMPQGLPLGSGGGFVAEYPWATSFNTVPDEEYSRPADLPAELLRPAWNSLSCEWEYDASLENMNAFVPARLFFNDDDLWWDGQGGYQRDDGRTVFLDPSFCMAGPSTLLADVEYLRARLREMDRCLIWTLLGAKWMLGGSMERSERTPIRRFRQVAYMDSAGMIRASDLVFFDDQTDRQA